MDGGIAFGAVRCRERDRLFFRQTRDADVGETTYHQAEGQTEQRENPGREV